MYMDMSEFYQNNIKAIKLLVSMSSYIKVFKWN